MKQIVLLAGSIFGLTSVVFGAFGAHKLKELISLEKLISFETGVKYQMYHALVLLFIGLFFKFDNKIQLFSGYFFIIGILLFSGSIYFLSTNQITGIKTNFLGPITPIGGLFLIVGWSLMVFEIIRMKF